MTAVARFAPSPTGLLHVGNARVALVNWLFARSRAGRFILRIDDTDPERSDPQFAAAITEDLRWLGLNWDELVRQSERMPLYGETLEGLKAIGRIYPCYETSQELEAKRWRQLRTGEPPLYDRAALGLTEAARKALEAEGRRPHWRFLLEARKIAWDDLVHGRIRFDAASLGDPVLVRSDGLPLYALTSVVDDILLKVTHIVRGDDHIANSAVQVQLFEALRAEAPAFAHLPLMTDIKGGGLSKRLGSLSLGRLREEGIEPMAVNSLLAKLGTSDPLETRLDLRHLVAEFDFAKFSRSGPKFDDEELKRLNARLLHETPFDRVRGRLKDMGLEEADESFWLAVRPNLERLADAEWWWRVCHGEVEPVITNEAVTAKAAELLPAGPWNGRTWTAENWEAWTGAVAAATGAKGEALFLPLRLALTGRDRGPELKNLLPMIGAERVMSRFKGKTA